MSSGKQSESDGNSNNETSKTPTTTIRIAAKEASKRAASGMADPGPGDLSAAPSVAPQLVDIPDPPTPSQLVVKTSGKTLSGKTATLQTIKEAQSVGASKGSHSSAAKKDILTITSATAPKLLSKQSSGSSSKMSSMSSHMSGNPKNSTLSKHSTSHNESGKTQKTASEHVSLGGTESQKHSTLKTDSGSARRESGTAETGLMSGGKSTSKPDAPETTNPTVSTAMQADSNVVHDEDEEGEGEVVNPEEGSTPSPKTSDAASPVSAENQIKSPTFKASASGGKSDSGIDSSPMSTGSAKASVKTGKKRMSSKSSPGRSSGIGSLSPTTFGKGKDGKKKVTKFRYHKRITVRTSGKTSPAKIMDKVNKKDNKVNITPSTIGEMDPQELMRRAGIKGNDKTHWRVRLRQTKRMTKDGKTVTQTKVAYRDSEGNKRVRTSTNPFCKHCGEKLENCRCDDPSKNS